LLSRISHNFKLVNPFEVAFALMFFISGLGLLIAAPDPASVVAVFPAFLRICWAIVLLIGGTFELYGVVSNRIEFRRAGLLEMATACFVYVIALVVYSNATVFFSVCLISGLIWACLEMFRRLR